MTKRSGGRTGARRPAPSGYSLVEIALVLVVLLMISSTAAWNLSDWIRNDQREGVQEYMGSVHEAVIAYANENRSRGADVAYRDRAVGGQVRITVHAPSGRPVLPCPDVDGDGFEDRFMADDPATLFTVTITARPEYVADLGNTPLRCIDSKGLLPWRTLGTQPADPWGQHYTYWVDGNFSHGSFGFDQDTKATPVYRNYAVRLEQSANVLSYPFRHNANAAPSVGSLRYFYRPGLVLERAPGTPDGYIVHAGEVSGTDISRQSFERRSANTADGPRFSVLEYGFVGGGAGQGVELDFAAAGVTYPFVSNGIAYAILSHGPNGLGGRVYQHGRSPSDPFLCRPFASYASRERVHEKINARLTFPCEVAEIAPGGCSGADLQAACGRDDSWTGVFVRAQPTALPVLPEDEGYDDVLVWMKTGTLIGRLTTDGIFPLPKPAVGYYATEF